MQRPTLTRVLDTEAWTSNHLALLGLVGLTVLALLASYGVRYSFGAYDPGYELTARFEGAGQNLDTQSVVKLRGVDVGQVESISLGDDDRAVVELRIEPDVDVPASAVAVIRPISIFGPKFIDLIPGPGEAEGPYLAEGDEITHTRPALELTDILGDANELLEAVDPQDLTTILHTFAEGVDGLDQEIAESITNARTVLDGMVASSDDRHELLGNMATIADDLADQGDTILGIGANSHEALPTISEHEEDFAGLLEATSRLSSGLSDVITANDDILGPAAEGGAVLADATADDLAGLVSYLDFVNVYGGVLGKLIRIPTDSGALALSAQFLLGSNVCETLISNLPGCEVPALDPAPSASGRN
jgi:phospholipid/cholesterol/gamma-HCH transport system substrate-binding protein